MYADTMRRSLFSILILVTTVFSLSCSTQQDSRFNPVLTDDFSDAASGWNVSTRENGDSAAYDKGEYITAINGADRIIWFRNSSPAYIQGDFSCEVDATNISGAGDDSECGIIFRGEKYDNFYVFKVKSSERSYSLAKLIRGQWSTLKDWTVSDNIKGGANTNRLGVTCIADSIEVSANGSKLASAIDKSLSSGYIALELGTWKNPSAGYKFDNFKLFTLKTLGIPAATPPASTPTPSASSSTVAQSQTPSTFADSVLLKNKSLDLVFQDNFGNPKSGWPEGSSAGGGYAYDNGEYSMWSTDPDAGKNVYNNTYQMPQDFAAEVDVRKISGGGSSTIGIGFRLNESHDGYVYVILSDGRYACVKSLQGKRTYLMDVAKAGSIPLGDKSVRLGVVCIGPQIELFADGKKLQSFNDGTLLKGTMSMRLGMTTDSSSESRYKFDNFKVYSVR